MSAVQRNVCTGKCSFDIAQAGLCRDSLDGGNKVDGVACVNHFGKLSFLLVDKKGSRLGSRAVENFSASVDGHGQIGTGTPNNIAEIVAVHHQKIQSGKASGSEQLGWASVQHDAETVINHI